MPIERDEAGVGKLRRRAQLAGAQRGRRASDAAEVAFDRIEGYGQRHGSREARAFDAGRAREMPRQTARTGSAKSDRAPRPRASRMSAKTRSKE